MPALYAVGMIYDRLRTRHSKLLSRYAQGTVELGDILGGAE